MGRKTLLVLFIFFLVLLPAGLKGQELVHRDQAEFNSYLVSEGPPVDQIIIKFVPGAEQQWLANREATLASLSQAAGIELAFYRPMSGDAFVLKMAERRTPAEAAVIAARLDQLDEVEYAAPDLIKQLADRPRTMLLATPNDTFFSDQWHYQYTAGSSEGLNLVPAWNITTGSATTVVAVIDTGILNHTDLAGRTVAGYDFISSTFIANDGNGRDNNPADPGDWITVNECGFPHGAQSSSWHGTHVAGTIGANTNNNLGVAGVNWATRILPVRVLGKCGGVTSDILDGVRWAAGLTVPGVPNNANPADVINLSLGGSGSCMTPEQNAYNDAVNAGTTVVVAAGNNNDNAANYSPASCNNVITVASNDRGGDKASYSNYGNVVEITAPGGETGAAFTNGVLSTLDSGATTPANDNVYAWYQGTSMATPHVAGLASLMLGLNDQLTPAQVLSYLQANARAFPGGSSCNTSICGSGIANAFATLQAIQPPIPMDESIYLPLIARTWSPSPPPAGDIKNGNFESGSADWTEFSTHGWDLIIQSGFPQGVSPHGGSWAVWLGGDYDDTSYIQQQVTVPAAKPHFTYWHWIASADDCGYDFAKVVINGSQTVTSYTLCDSLETGGWVKYSVNLGAWSNQTVNVQIRVETDSSLNSNLFVDDVSFQASPAAAAGTPAPAGPPSSTVDRQTAAGGR